MKRITFSILTLCLLSGQNIMAQDNFDHISVDTASTSAMDSNMGASEENFDFETIDVDGLSKKKSPKKEKLSMADKMKIMRDRMEKRTADMVMKNIEKTRIKMELDMLKKINAAMELQMNQNLKAMD